MKALLSRMCSLARQHFLNSSARRLDNVHLTTHLVWKYSRLIIKYVAASIGFF